MSEDPKTPYRDGKPLTEIIPPDNRRKVMATVVIASMIAGIVLWEVAGSLAVSLRARTAVATATSKGSITPSVLHGPGGDTEMPPKARAIIHVWLQGCEDCMPAFEAIRELNEKGGFGIDVPIYNVAYGEADLTWANRYTVGTHLVFDPQGTSVVRPLGIGTFTTLVTDDAGQVIHRDRPDRPGYRDRVRAALGVSGSIVPGDPLQ